MADFGAHCADLWRMAIHYLVCVHATLVGRLGNRNAPDYLALVFAARTHPWSPDRMARVEPGSVLPAALTLATL